MYRSITLLCSVCTYKWRGHVHVLWSENKRQKSMQAVYTVGEVYKELLARIMPNNKASLSTACCIVSSFATCIHVSVCVQVCNVCTTKQSYRTLQCSYIWTAYGATEFINLLTLNFCVFCYHCIYSAMGFPLTTQISSDWFSVHSIEPWLHFT